MNYRSFNDLNHVILRSLPRLPRDVDVVVGIPRSGLLAANLIALYWNKPLTDVQGFIKGRILGGGSRMGEAGGTVVNPRTARVLVVDDSIQSGAEICRIRGLLQEAGVGENARFFCVFADPKSVSRVDFYGEMCPLPRVFEWNMMHHPHLEHSCVDIDGVLCCDPTAEQNDDGPAYERFLCTVEPMVVPAATIGWLVTSRLEKYRRATEDWLARHGFRYRELVMMQHPDKAARVAAGDHAAYKAATYLRTPAILFIESSRRQAIEIARISGRPVFCTETREMLRSSDPASSEGSHVHASEFLADLKEDIARFIKPDQAFILVDEDQLRWSMPEFKAIPFLENHGQYWGPPPDDATALRELDRLRNSGARFVVFIWQTFWWLKHYSAFARHLRSHCTTRVESERLLIFDLQHPPTK